MNDAKQPRLPVEIHRLFHSLWTKAVGTPTYDKAQWNQMDNFLHCNPAPAPHRETQPEPCTSHAYDPMCGNCNTARSLAGEAAQPREIKAKDLANVVEWLIQQDLALYPEGFRQNGIAISSDLESSVILIMERYATSRLAVSTPPAQLGNEFADFVQVEYREGKAYLKLHIDNALDFTLSEYPTLAGAEQDATMVRGALVQLFNKLKFRLTPPVASAPVSKVLLNELREISVLIFSRAQSTPEGADLENISFRLDDLIKTAEAAALSPAQAVPPANFVSTYSLPTCHVCGSQMIGLCPECKATTTPSEPSAQAVAGEPHTTASSSVTYRISQPSTLDILRKIAQCAHKMHRDLSELSCEPEIDKRCREISDLAENEVERLFCAAPEPVAEPPREKGFNPPASAYRHSLRSLIEVAERSREHKLEHRPKTCCCAVAKGLLEMLETSSGER